MSLGIGGMAALSLGEVPRGKGDDDGWKEDEAKAMQEAEVSTTFLLPKSVGGGQLTHEFCMGKFSCTNFSFLCFGLLFVCFLNPSFQATLCNI